MSRHLRNSPLAGKWPVRLSLALCVAQIALVVLSWLVAAVFPQSRLRSLLSSEGLRWFFGQFAENIACQPVVLLLLLSIGWGTARRGGLWDILSLMTGRQNPKKHPLAYRERFALIMVCIEILVFLTVMLLLTCVPHAVLLNVEGGLLSGVFPASILPAVAFVMLLTGLTYGSLCGRLTTTYDYCEALASGPRAVAAWWLPVVLSAELYASVLYVFF